jgi:hypothetical protein
MRSSILFGRFPRPRRVGRVPGHHELPVRRETGAGVEVDRRLVLAPRPDVAEGHAALLEEPDGLGDERLPDPAASIRVRHEHLRHLAFEPRPGVEEHAPAEAGEPAVVGADRKHDVLAVEPGRDAADEALELGAGQLRVVGVVRLLRLVEIDEERPDEVVLLRREALDADAGHPPGW